ncbi:MAG: GNAT family N-acetyltransferase [Gammaproteobacteria bacterium]|nr:GNAT family N-acetyltransferase [Gammaproteobacteria bacterium]
MNGFCVRIVPWDEHAGTLRAIRDRVFIEEQRVPENLERDPRDPSYVHALAETGAGEPIGTGRLLPGGKIGRMAVLPEWRSRRVGSALLEALISVARERGDREIVLDAQVSAEVFYRRQGFSSEGDVFMDAGIPHVRMRLAL